MSYVRSFGLNGKSLYANVAMPKQVYLKFIVDSTNGQGVRSLKSNGYVEYVFMHTSTTPTSVHDHLNPNPPAGYALICFKSNFNKFLGEFDGKAIASANASQSSVSANGIYSITALGTATLAQWQAKGFPAGFTPAVGSTFVATASGTIGGSATVGDPGVPLGLITTVVGDPNQMLNNSNISQNGGAVVAVQFAGPTINTGAFNSPYLATAPADGTTISMSFCFDGSSVSIDGI